jgi:hypothetical protein
MCFLFVLLQMLNYDIQSVPCFVLLDNKGKMAMAPRATLCSNVGYGADVSTAEQVKRSTALCCLRHWHFILQEQRPSDIPFTCAC